VTLACIDATSYHTTVTQPLRQVRNQLDGRSSCF